MEEPECENSSQRSCTSVLGQDKMASEEVCVDYAWTLDKLIILICTHRIILEQSHDVLNFSS